jgi:hypothetical protein
MRNGGLVDRHYHGFADEPPAEEVLHDILIHRFQPVVARDQVVLPPQCLLQLGFLLGVEFGCLGVRKRRQLPACCAGERSGLRQSAGR